VLAEDRGLGTAGRGEERLVEVLDLVVEAMKDAVDPEDHPAASGDDETLLAHDLVHEWSQGVGPVVRDDQVNLVLALEKDRFGARAVRVGDRLLAELDAVGLLRAGPVGPEVAAESDLDVVGAAIVDEL